jgi:hypothetical protein
LRGVNENRALRPVKVSEARTLPRHGIVCGIVNS